VIIFILGPVGISKCGFLSGWPWDFADTESFNWWGLLPRRFLNGAVISLPPLLFFTDEVNGLTNRVWVQRKNYEAKPMDNSEFVVRLPQHFVDKLHEHEITASMLLTITLLYRLADWTTGRVKWVSAGGLHTWSNKAYKENTFSEALRRFEQMGHITRHTTLGSHHDYPVTLHNYPKLELVDDGKGGHVQKCVVINLNSTKTWDEAKSSHQSDDEKPIKPKAAKTYSQPTNRQSDETVEEGGDERGEEGGDERGEKVLSISLSDNLSNNLSENLSETTKPKERKKEGRKEDGSSLRSSPSSAEQELVKPIDPPSTPLELKRSWYLHNIWQEKTKQDWYEWSTELDGFNGSEMDAAIRLMQQVGWLEMLDVLTLTFECPKTAGMTWEHWVFWIKHFELTQRTTNAWRNKLMAKGVESKTSKACRNYTECQNWQAPGRGNLCVVCWSREMAAIGRELCLHPYRMSDGECFECGHMKVDPETCIHEHLDDDGNQCRDCGKLRGVAAEAKHA
jgi:hypothetical protein